MNTAGQNVLASISNQSVAQGYRPKLIEFYGYEGEDFRHFQEILESFLAISNTNTDARRLVILKSQLRRAAKIYFERVILKENPTVTYEEAIEQLKKHYITPELIQNYELEFNEMMQGEQEHPQIFLSRLREAADLANITSEEVVESRFRAGLLKDIKQFCIQSSSRNFQDWTNHADGWWNANRPRKIAMVDNPFIPRNVSHALIYNEEITHPNRYLPNHHNLEIIDGQEQQIQYVPVSDPYTNGRRDSQNLSFTRTMNQPQLSTMDIGRKLDNSQYLSSHNMQHHSNGLPQHSNQSDILNLIQQTIRNELNTQQPTGRPYNKTYRSNNNGNYKGNFNNYNNGNYNNGNYNNGNYNNGNSGYTNNRNYGHNNRNGSYNNDNGRYNNNTNNGHYSNNNNDRRKDTQTDYQYYPSGDVRQTQPSKN
ncbi:hypothetical protein G6F17_012935 [Rhizopus arrhizus]|nr:hypothetical protein G6F17_012935 [Rhizopus arrhizus]KAG0904051.1 hypothetical protein G6F33_012826 [Rhizopus arrhizus]KAG1162165.1 hypothetical protein G6F36_013900 [Rhizopus arrhizus]KAG1369213.1 hypothetical protein G6F61_012526 [Rhizopus arrhizus]